MRRVDLELLVQRAVEDMRAGRPREDDRIEVKSDWPDATKARQLAGAANALRGEPLIYIIGCHEDGTLAEPVEQDPEAWHSTLRAAFDSPAPRLAMHSVVAVGEGSGETVTALLFETDEFPYVMRVSGVTDRREVPVRVASGTASANRAQLLRILAPTLAAPRCEVSDAEVNAYLNDYEAVEADEPLGQESRPARSDLSLSARVQMFIEYVGTSSASVQTRSVRARIRASSGETWELTTHVHPSAGYSRDRPAPAPLRFGVYVSRGVIAATGPGEFSMQASTTVSASSSAEESLLAHLTALDEAEYLTLEVRLKFAAVERPVIVRAGLTLSAKEGKLGPDRWGRTWKMSDTSEDW